MSWFILALVLGVVLSAAKRVQHSEENHRANELRDADGDRQTEHIETGEVDFIRRPQLCTYCCVSSVRQMMLEQNCGRERRQCELVKEAIDQTRGNEGRGLRVETCCSGDGDSVRSTCNTPTAAGFLGFTSRYVQSWADFKSLIDKGYLISGGGKKYGHQGMSYGHQWLFYGYEDHVFNGRSIMLYDPEHGGSNQRISFQEGGMDGSWPPRDSQSRNVRLGNSVYEMENSRPMVYFCGENAEPSLSIQNLQSKVSALAGAGFSNPAANLRALRAANGDANEAAMAMALVARPQTPQRSPRGQLEPRHRAHANRSPRRSPRHRGSPAQSTQGYAASHHRLGTPRRDFAF